MADPIVPRFALNHIVSPRLGPADFFGLAISLGLTEVEIRNDLPGRAILDGTAPEALAAAAGEAGVTILAINALQRFNDWTPGREHEATSLARYAAASGARALVLVPVNDGSGRGDRERGPRLRRALEGLQPILAGHGLVGLIEPLGFPSCSLRSKREAAAAIEAAGAEGTFRLVHDTFHHALAGEPDRFPGLTGLAHISGVSDPDVPVAEMRDAHRALVEAGDRLETVRQIAQLAADGYDGPFSFEPFAAEVQELADPRPALAASIAHIRHRLATQAA
jgi:2-keto-myo-inositol isomerase